MKIAVGHHIFQRELIKSPIICVDNFSKICDSQRKKRKKKDTILKIVEFIWIITITFNWVESK